MAVNRCRDAGSIRGGSKSKDRLWNCRSTHHIDDGLKRPRITTRLVEEQFRIGLAGWATPC